MTLNYKQIRTYEDVLYFRMSTHITARVNTNHNEYVYITIMRHGGYHVVVEFAAEDIVKLIDSDGDTEWADHINKIRTHVSKTRFVINKVFSTEEILRLATVARSAWVQMSNLCISLVDPEAKDLVFSIGVEVNDLTKIKYDQHTETCYWEKSIQLRQTRVRVSSKERKTT